MNLLKPLTAAAPAKSSSQPPQDMHALRKDGGLALEHYAALGDGRGVAICGIDGSIDWLCVPHMDSPPLFDRLLDDSDGGRFSIQPEEPFTAQRRYLPDSNVLETVFVTASGRAKLTESMNSGPAGRLPWAELARRVEGLDGHVRFTFAMIPGRRGLSVNPYHARVGAHTVFHVGKVLGVFVCDDAVTCHWADEGITGTLSVGTGDKRTVAIVAASAEPLVVPSVDDIDARIDTSHAEWRDWSDKLVCAGRDRAAFVRSALALKLLLHSPSGAIVAAATSSLPENLKGGKNWDYRYAWVRDAGYTINAFLAAGAHAEAKAALGWLLDQLREHGVRVCYSLAGDTVPDVRFLPLSGWRGIEPVVQGNRAGGQTQHGVYGDIFETASRFVECGNILDAGSAELLAHLADECADRWRLPDSGIWELEEEAHYTMSKVSCWQALQRAVELADDGQLPTTCRERWARERDRVRAWIEDNCWSEKKQAFVMKPGSDKLDASLTLAVRFGFDGHERLRLTMDAIDRELGAGPFHYRYSGMAAEEGCFLACSYWMVEARALLGQQEKARAALDRLDAALAHGCGILPEMIEPDTGTFLGNLPQGLSHLAHLMALATLDFQSVCE